VRHIPMRETVPDGSGDVQDGVNREISGEGLGSAGHFVKPI